MYQRYALIIGNDEYDDEVFKKYGRLHAPQKDVEAIYNLLVDPDICGFLPENVVKLLNPTCGVAKEKIEGFFEDKDYTKDDLILIYFAGHAELHPRDNELILLVKNSVYKRLSATGISRDYIAQFMMRCKSERLLLILDCCYSGRFSKGIRRGKQSPVGTPVVFDEQIKNGRGKFVLAACSAVQRAYDADEDDVKGNIENSLFARFLIQGIETGEADRDNDGKISLTELSIYIHDNVTNEAKKKNLDQEPTLDRSDERGDFFIALNPAHQLSIYVYDLQNSNLSLQYIPITLNRPLYLPHLAQQTNIVIAQRHGTIDSRLTYQIVYTAIAKPAKQPFFIKAHQDPSSGLISCRIDSGDLIPIEIDYKEFQVGENIEISQEPIQICFIVDGTLQSYQMPDGTMGNELEQVFNFIYEVAISSLFPDTTFACCIYGEHKKFSNNSVYKGHNPFPLDLDFTPFGTLQDLEIFIEEALSFLPSPNFASQDYSDCMELALEKATELSWTSKMRYVVIIGNSPPHPIIEDLKKFDLLDYSVDEFDCTDWLSILNRLHRNKVHTISYWLDPYVPLPKNVKEYTRYVWKRLNNGRQYQEISNRDTFNQAIKHFNDYIFQAQIMEMKKHLKFPITGQMRT